MNLRCLLFAGLMVAGHDAGLLPAAEPTAKDVEFFEKKVRPVLVQHCYKCHSADAKDLKGDLLLDTKAGVAKGGESGPVIKSGDPNASPLIKSLRYTDKNLKMPPDGKLPEAVINDLATWVRNGAPDPRTSTAKVVSKAANEIDLQVARDFWSFQPVKKAAPPAVQTANWPHSDIDRFVLAKLEANKMLPVADADPATLVRRVYLDLIGLPPPPGEVEYYVRNPNPQAFERIVDKLLASPQFGERWGRHWLDVARFGESNGNTDNILFPYAWRYRDYVIAAYNADTPYDKFLQQQLAGDLLPAKDASEQDRNVIATGFLAFASKPRKQNNPDYEMDIVADQIEVATTALMGLTLECARCHDHKFDPISMKDYYAVAGMFTSTQTLHTLKGGDGKNAKKATAPTGLHPVLGDTNAKSVSAAITELDGRIGKAKIQLDKLIAAAQPAAAKPNSDGATKKKLKQELRQAAVADKVDTPEVRQLRDEIKSLETQREKLKAEAPEPSGWAMGVREGRPGDCALCIRGESNKRGEVVPRGFVWVVNYTPELKINPKQSGRLELAKWITSKENPMTARNYANRIWSHLFGIGIVRSTDNFGALGEKPSHPELLDYLATYLMDHGWSTKQLIKAIVLSRTYQLGSAHDARCVDLDPENRLLWRHAPRRLDAEVIRDSVLAVSGELDLTPMKGTTVSRYGETDVKSQLLEQITHQDHRHRSVYLPAVRNAAPEALGLFDIADSSLIVGARMATNIPTQALYLINSPFVRTNAQKAAEKLLAATDDDGALLEKAYLRTYGRRPTSAEREQILKYMSDTAGTSAVSADKRKEAWTNVYQALFTAAEFRYQN